MLKSRIISDRQKSKPRKEERSKIYISKESSKRKFSSNEFLNESILKKSQDQRYEREDSSRSGKKEKRKQEDERRGNWQKAEWVDDQRRVEKTSKRFRKDIMDLSHVQSRSQVVSILDVVMVVISIFP